MTIQEVNIAVGKQLGITEADAITPANLEPAIRTKLFDYSFAYVAQHPSDFTEKQVKIAQQHFAAWGVNTPLNDTSFDWGMLADELGNNAVKLGESVASIGTGTMNLLNMAKWLIPLVVIIWIAIKLNKAAKQ